MEANFESLIQQADELKKNLEAVNNQSKKVGYNMVGIKECAETLQKCINKVGNNRLAALANRDKRKVYAEMEDAIEQLLELID
jgi:wobble nucleotide-excising tRNase